MIRTVVLLLAACVAGSAYTRSATEAGIPLWRPDAANIQFLIHPSVKAGATSDDGGVSITASSDPLAGLSAAAAAWSAVPDSTVRFAPLQETTLLNSPRDRQHVIMIVDSAETRSIVGSYLALTVWAYTVSDGSITDTDILLNPRVVDGGKQVSFSTDRASGTYDLQSVVTHEFGHALGASHSGVITAAMFQNTNAFLPFLSVADATLQAWLATDDVAFLVAAYPAQTVGERYGRITGTVRYDNGAGVRVPMVIATDPATGVVVGIPGSPENGTYTMQGVPPGKYRVYAQPLDGPVTPGNLGTPGSAQADIFRTTFAGGNEQPALVEVEAGASPTVDIVVDSATPGMHINHVGIGSVGGGDWSYASSRAIASARSWDILLWGKGIDAGLRLDQILVLAPGITVREGSLREQRTAMVNGVAAMRFTVDVAARASRTHVPIAIVKGGDGVANSAGLVLLPGGTPAPELPVEAVAITCPGRDPRRQVSVALPGPVALVAAGEKWLEATGDGSELRLAVDPTALNPGEYRTTVKVGSFYPELVVPVVVTVTAPPAPARF